MESEKCPKCKIVGGHVVGCKWPELSGEKVDFNDLCDKDKIVVLQAKIELKDSAYIALTTQNQELQEQVESLKDGWLEAAALREVLGIAKEILKQITKGKEIAQLPGFPPAFVCIPIENKNKAAALLLEVERAKEGKVKKNNTDARACDKCENTAMSWANYEDKQGWLCEICGHFVQTWPIINQDLLAKVKEILLWLNQRNSKYYTEEDFRMQHQAATLLAEINRLEKGEGNV